MIVTKVNFGEQIIRVVGVHTLSPTNRFRLDIRNRQFVEIGDALLAEATPTVVMGDFNCTPWSPFLSDFLKRTGYRDSRQGFGYQPSWPSMYQLLRIPIDHAFVSEDIHVHNRYIGKPPRSDHLPIVFEISTAVRR